MAGENTLATLNGLFKEIYADAVKDLLPSAVKLQKAVGFVRKGKEIGGSYNQPVVLSHEHGFTFNDPGTVGDAFALNNAVAQQSKNASIKSVEMVLRSRLSYVAAARAKNSAAAFVDTTEHLVKGMRTSFTKKLEIELFYGQSNIGVLSADVSGQNITISAATWAPGIWSGSEGSYIQIFPAGSDDIGDARNGGQAYSASDSRAYKISAVNNSTRTLTLVGTVTGIVATDEIYIAGAFGKEMAGLHKIMSNTGTLFGIDASAFNLWKGNTYTPTGITALTFSTISNAIDLAIAKGLDEDVTLYCSSKAFSDLLYDASLKRQVDASYDSGKQVFGSNEFGFVGQNGRVRIVPSIYVKEGYAYLVVESDFTRIGSTDVTFTRPGQKDSFFLDLQDNAGYELRAYTDQALFCTAPGKQVLITGLVPGDFTA